MWTVAVVARTREPRKAGRSRREHRWCIRGVWCPPTARRTRSRAGRRGVLITRYRRAVTRHRSRASFESRSRQQERQPGCALIEVHQQVRAAGLPRRRVDAPSPRRSGHGGAVWTKNKPRSLAEHGVDVRSRRQDRVACRMPPHHDSSRRMRWQGPAAGPAGQSYVTGPRTSPDPSCSSTDCLY